MVFEVALNAVMPYVIYLALGFLFKKTNIIEKSLYPKLNQVIYKAFFPITMFYNTYKMKVNLGESLSLIVICAVLLFVFILLSVIVVSFFEKSNARRGVIVQCLYRSNIILFGISMVETVFGSSAVSLMAVIIAIFVPVYNVLAIIILEYYGSKQTDILQLIIKIFKNPLFIGAFAGVVFSTLPFSLPTYVDVSISKISAMTTPLAMIILGGMLELHSILNNFKTINVVLLFKMFVFPLVAILVCLLFKLSSVETFIVFLLFGSPVSTNAYTISENMGADGKLAGELVVTSTIFSIVTLFIWITVLRGFSII